MALVAGGGCAQIVGADFDKPFKGEGTGDSTPSTSSGGTGGTASSTSVSSGAGGSSGAGTPTSTASSSSSGDAASSSSSGSGGACVPTGTVDTECGPDGKDGNCDGKVGICGTLPIYVGMLPNDTTTCVAATDVLVTDIMSDISGGGFKLLSQFNAFATMLPSTVPLNVCIAGGKKAATLDNALPCMLGTNQTRTVGYVSTKAGMGYEQLKALAVKGGISGFGVQNTMYADVCCHVQTCTDVVAGFVPQ